MIKLIRRGLARLNKDSFVQEIVDNTNLRYRTEELEKHYTIKERGLLEGKATPEGYNYFRSRNIEGMIKSG